MGVLREVADYSGKFFSDKWIRKNILRQTDDEIEEIDRQIEEEKAIQTAEIEAQSTQQEVEQAAQQATMDAEGGEGGVPPQEESSPKSQQQESLQPVTRNIYDVSDLL